MQLKSVEKSQNQFKDLLSESSYIHTFKGQTIVPEIRIIWRENTDKTINSNDDHSHT